MCTKELAATQTRPLTTIHVRTYCPKQAYMYISVKVLTPQLWQFCGHLISDIISSRTIQTLTLKLCKNNQWTTSHDCTYPVATTQHNESHWSAKPSAQQCMWFCMLTRNRSLSRDSHACHVHCFVPAHAKFAHEFLTLFHRACATYL